MKLEESWTPSGIGNIAYLDLFLVLWAVPTILLCGKYSENNTAVLGIVYGCCM